MTASRDLPQNMRQGIDAARKGNYLAGLTLLGNFYGERINIEPAGLSWYGLCVAMINKNYKQAVECCTVALEGQPKNADHYLNLAKIYLQSGNRKKAVETADRGLGAKPSDPALIALREQLGVRARPAVPFLRRGNPLNVAIGQVRHAARKKRAARPAKKK